MTPLAPIPQTLAEVTARVAELERRQLLVLRLLLASPLQYQLDALREEYADDLEVLTAAVDQTFPIPDSVEPPNGEH